MTQIEGAIERSTPLPRIPENFRSTPEGYYPHRIVESTKRVKALQEINSHFEPRTQERLFDLVIYNAYGRVFPTPNSASDFIGVVDDTDGYEPPTYSRQAAYSPYENCIVLGKVKGQLALLGGFNDIGEAMTQTAVREATEEGNIKSIESLSFVGEASAPDRDERFAVVSSLVTGIVKADEIKNAGDDAEGVFIVKLTNGFFGTLNPELRSKGSGTITDIYGNKIAHNGIRADHRELLRKLHWYWKSHGIPGQSLATVVRKMSGTVPQEWFEGATKHPKGMDNYSSISIGTDRLLLTPNIQFTIEQATKIFVEAGEEQETAISMAQKFALDAYKADVLPLFPQAAVTLDCVILEGDTIIAHKLPNGQLSLPETFYSPEKDDITDNLSSTAKQNVHDKYGISYEPHYYLGTVGGTVALGKQADDRYPRLSHVYVGVANRGIPTAGSKLPSGSEIVKIPIWKDKEKGVLSDEICNGLHNQGWIYGHNKEILETLFVNTLNTITRPEEKVLSAEEIFATQSIVH